MHNDARGATALGGQYSGGGLSGINNSVGLNWGLYRDSNSNRVYCVINDVPQKGGIYSSANTSWITGSGILAVTYPAFSTTIILR